MIGYVIKVEELEQTAKFEKLEGRQDLDEKSGIFKNCFFVEPVEMEEKYPIPTAFQRYTKYINISLGNDKFKN